jgi:hypothetical protein
MIDNYNSLAEKFIRKWFWLYIFSFIIWPIWYIIKIIISGELSVEEVWVLYWIISLVTMIWAYNDLWMTESLKYYLPKYVTNKDFKNSYRIFESIAFNDFLTILKNAKCMVWNSSAWVRQAPTLWIPTVNIWSRQNNRNDWETIHNVWSNSHEVKNKINEIWEDNKIYPKCLTFGDWKGWDRFIKILETENFWKTSIQK